MSGYNRVTLIGNLTRDPQRKDLPGGSSVVEFGLATSRRFKSAGGEDREEVCYLDCAAFGRQGDVIHQFCRKGRQLFVEGRLKYQTWEEKGSDTKRSKISVVVETFQFLQPPKDGDPATRVQHEQLEFPRRAADSQERVDPPFDRESKFQEADIPF